MCGCGARAKSRAEKNAELTKDAKAIVAGVEGYSKADRDKRAAEVKAAFPPERKTTAKAAMVKSDTKKTVKAVAKPAVRAAKMTKTAAKTSAKKQPTPAGISTWPHDGDQC